MSGLPGPVCPGIHLCGLLNLPTRPTQERRAEWGRTHYRGRMTHYRGQKKTHYRGGRAQRTKYTGERNGIPISPMWKKRHKGYNSNKISSYLRIVKA